MTSSLPSNRVCATLLPRPWNSTTPPSQLCHTPLFWPSRTCLLSLLRLTTPSKRQSHSRLFWLIHPHLPLRLLPPALMVEMNPLLLLLQSKSPRQKKLTWEVCSKKIIRFYSRQILV